MVSSSAPAQEAHRPSRGGLHRRLRRGVRPRLHRLHRLLLGREALASARTLLEVGACDAVIAGGADALCRLTANGFQGSQHAPL